MMPIAVAGGDLNAVPGYEPDRERDPRLQPGKLIYSAKFDRDRLKCFYKCQCICLNNDVLVKRTFLDVYEEGVLFNAPCAVCCGLCWSDRANFAFWGTKFLKGEPKKAGVCSPFPYCCPHCFNCCGETVAFPLGTFKICIPEVDGHWCCMIPLCCIILFPAVMITGLRDGEGDSLQTRLNGASAAAKARGEAGLAFPTSVGGAAMPMSPTRQDIL